MNKIVCRDCDAELSCVQVELELSEVGLLLDGGTEIVERDEIAKDRRFYCPECGNEITKGCCIESWEDLIDDLETKEGNEDTEK